MCGITNNVSVAVTEIISKLETRKMLLWWMCYLILVSICRGFQSPLSSFKIKFFLTDSLQYQCMFRSTESFNDFLLLVWTIGLLLVKQTPTLDSSNYDHNLPLSSPWSWMSNRLNSSRIILTFFPDSRQVVLSGCTHSSSFDVTFMVLIPLQNHWVWAVM